MPAPRFTEKLSSRSVRVLEETSMTRRVAHAALLVVSAWMLLALTGAPAAAQSVSVTAANPASGTQDTLGLVVKITGKNFAPGARSQFLLSGTTNPDGIVV